MSVTRRRDAVTKTRPMMSQALMMDLRVMSASVNDPL